MVSQFVGDGLSGRREPTLNLPARLDSEPGSRIARARGGSSRGETGMTGISRLMASAAVGGLALLGLSKDARADGPGPVARPAQPRGGRRRQVPFTGVVQDENGAPVGGAVVSALGATTAYAVTDRSGRFELRALSPGAVPAASPFERIRRLTRPDDRGAAEQPHLVVDRPPHAPTPSAAECFDSCPRDRSTVPAHRRAIPTAIRPAPILRAGLGLPESVFGGAPRPNRSTPDDDPADRRRRQRFPE